MNQQTLIKRSKFLSLILRHNPEKIGLTLDNQGWVKVEELLMQMNAHGKRINKDILDTVVANDNKQRFIFNDNKTKIRANQGHSISIDLGYTPQIPPAVLYHGTATRFIDSINVAGAIQKMKRHHVHLSSDLDTAVNVGTRHGKLIIFAVDTASMLEEGYTFYISGNGVWLVDEVPVKFLEKVEDF